jgi:hypothetical protein
MYTTSSKSSKPSLKLLSSNCGDCRSGSAEPAGGIARFQSVVNEYRSHPRFQGQVSLLTFFSGDAFNPSLESSVTKGRHMVPFLNAIGTDVACVGVSMAFKSNSAQVNCGLSWAES